MAATTLAIGSSAYQLLDLVNGAPQPSPPSKAATVVGTVRALSVQAPGGGTLKNFGIGPGSSFDDGTINNNLLNVRATLENFKADLGAGNDTLNIVGAVAGASIEMDDSGPFSTAGNDLLSISGNLTGIKSPPTPPSSGQSDLEARSQIYTGGGNDTVRIGGIVEDSNFYLGDGNDSLVISGDASRLYVDAGSGRDLVEFRGLANDAVVHAGQGNDTVIFRKNLSGWETEINNFGPSSLVTAVELGSGNDSLILGGGATNARINSGSGSDTLRLTGRFDNVAFHLDGVSEVQPNPDTRFATGDLITATAGSSFTNTTFSSASTVGDTLVVGAGSSFSSTNFYLGSGSDSLAFGSGAVFNDVLFSTGGGNDTLVFGSNTIFDESTIDLGAGSDLVSFDEYTFLGGVTVIGGAGDILYVGTNRYAYGNGAISLANSYTADPDSLTPQWMSNWFKA